MPPVVFIELRRANGSIQRATGDDATAIWRGIVAAMNCADTYGPAYRGPKLQVIDPPDTTPSDHAPSLESKVA